MKKKIAIIMLLTAILLTGCDDTTDVLETIVFENDRFEYIETLDTYWNNDMLLIRDKGTGVNYILIDEYQRLSMCPLYNENGDVVITE